MTLGIDSFPDLLSESNHELSERAGARKDKDNPVDFFDQNSFPGVEGDLFTDRLGDDNLIFRADFNADAHKLLLPKGYTLF
jgi:hypothetical protein